MLSKKGYLDIEEVIEIPGYPGDEDLFPASLSLIEYSNSTYFAIKGFLQIY